MKIDEIRLQRIKNSRGEETFEVSLRKGNYSVSTSSPSGKSKGRYEAKTIPLVLAQKRFNKLKKEILKKDFTHQREFDNFLIKKAGRNKGYLGVHLVLGLSMAFARLLAKKQKIPLWKYLKQQQQETITNNQETITNNQETITKQPLFFFNLINGGAHAPSGPVIQEYLVVPLKRPKESLKLGQRFFAEVKRCVGHKNLGDEGGIVLQKSDPEYPLFVYEKIRRSLKLTFRDIRYSLDCAANSFYKNKKYNLFARSPIHTKKLLDFYSFIIPKYKIFSLEDPFAENDHKGFKNLFKKFCSKIYIVGDDLTVTHYEKIIRAYKEKLINAVLIKPNQVGTVTETIDALNLCRKLNLKTIVSHRSGETIDAFISDLTVASCSLGLKSGAPGRKERMVKYKRVVKIFDSYGKI